jgi:formate-dependent nitrite reductase membrane component NrfD
MADVAYPPPWGWRVAGYFLSKGVAAGAMILAVLLQLVGANASALADIVPGAVALAGMAVTGVFLIAGLKQPHRFCYLWTRAQLRSWLAIGAQFINTSALIALVFTAAAVLGLHGLRDALRWAMVPAGIVLAGYAAFLFNQCEGRDLLQSPLLFAHTIVNALVAGAASLGVIALFVDAPAVSARALGWILALGAAASAGIIALDLVGGHATEQAEPAALNVWRDLYAKRFWLGGILLGLVLPGLLAMAFLALGETALLAIDGVLALIGLWFYEDAWVRAGQSVPLS